MMDEDEFSDDERIESSRAGPPEDSNGSLLDELDVGELIVLNTQLENDFEEFKKMVFDTSYRTVLDSSSEGLSDLAESVLKNGSEMFFKYEKLFSAIHEGLKHDSERIEKVAENNHHCCIYNRLIRQFCSHGIVPAKSRISGKMKEQHEKKLDAANKNKCALPIQLVVGDMNSAAPDASFWDGIPNEQWYPPPPSKLLESVLTPGISEKSKRELVIQYLVDWYRASESSTDDDEIARKAHKIVNDLLGSDMEKILHILEQEKDATKEKPKDFKFAKNGSEAQRGDTFGTFECNDFPAIPSKKFGKNDLDKYGNTKKDWTVQAVYPTSSSHQYLVIYEGWASNTGLVREESELKKTASKMLKACQERMDIIKALENKTGKVFEHDAVKLQSKPKSGFWTMEDASYFHSNYLASRHLPPIYFMTDIANIKKFPKHICMFRNMIHPNAKNQLKRNPKGKSIDLVRKDMQEKNDTPLPILFKKPTNPCPSKKCQCDVREDYVYRPQELGFKRLQYDKKGRLIVENCQARFLIECSDICQCCSKCPARTVQRGQQVPLVITFEKDKKGFGVRAGGDIEKGQFITEYTGIIRLLEDKENVVNERCLAECKTIEGNMVIDASEKGNAARFINHSCTPNSIFIEVHSRAKENDVLAPRVAVFATKEIEQGEEVTIRYYSETTCKYYK